MVEPAPAIVPGPVGRAIAPPSEAALGRWDEAAADVDPVVRLLQPGQRIDLNLRVADDVDQFLVVPYVAFQWRDVEVADDDRRFGQRFRPARHALDEIEFLPKFRILVAIGNVAARGHVDVFEPDSAIEPNTDVTRLAIVLPVVAARIAQRNPAEDRDAMVHPLPVELLVAIAELVEHRGGADVA